MFKLIIKSQLIKQSCSYTERLLINQLPILILIQISIATTDRTARSIYINSASSNRSHKQRLLRITCLHCPGSSIQQFRQVVEHYQSIITISNNNNSPVSSLSSHRSALTNLTCSIVRSRNHRLSTVRLLDRVKLAGRKNNHLIGQSRLKSIKNGTR